MAKVPRHFDRLFEGADGVAEGVQLGEKNGNSVGFHHKEWVFLSGYNAINHPIFDGLYMFIPDKHGDFGDGANGIVLST